jgi:hypothetical protein
MIVQRRGREHVGTLAENDDADAIGFAPRNEVANHGFRCVESSGANRGGAFVDVTLQVVRQIVHDRLHRPREVQHYDQIDAFLVGRLRSKGIHWPCQREHHQAETQGTCHAGQVSEPDAKPHGPVPQRFEGS